MKEIILETILDTIKSLPFLFIAFLILEFIEHKMNSNSKKILTKNKKYGPILGSFLGAFPQCGFGAMATNLYSKRVITIGTLFAVYLSTSDEMLPLLIANSVNYSTILKIISIKVLIALLIGIVIDVIFKKKEQIEIAEIHDMCHDEDCHCEKGIFKSSIKHTINIAFFLLIIALFINIIIFNVGEDNIKLFLSHKNYFSYFLSSLIGLIPNCASSVIITELYLNNILSLGNMFSGLLTGAGISLVLLFKTNKNIKENICILLGLYFIGVVCGIIIDALGLVL